MKSCVTLAKMSKKDFLTITDCVWMELRTRLNKKFKTEFCVYLLACIVSTLEKVLRQRTYTASLSKRVSPYHTALQMERAKIIRLPKTVGK